MDTKSVFLALSLLLLVTGGHSKHKQAPLEILSSISERIKSPLMHPWNPVNPLLNSIETKRPGEPQPELNLDGGPTLYGTYMYSLNNRSIDSFLGIKYADNVGRFQYSNLSLSLMELEGEIMADHMGEKCYQNSMVGDFAAGTEDCLFLNVFVPTDAREGGTPMPVMVFIHGGSFTSGDASLYLPTRLLDEEDVILVVIQYRLGAFGWFSLLNDDAPGNAGLSDQINALKWVQENIVHFSGDKTMVTVFGQSAGSASVSLLVAIGDKTEGLFANALAESGSALEYWAIDEHPVESATALALLCGCQDYITETGIYTCLFSKSAEELTMCTSNSVEQQHKNGGIGFDGVSPVVQPPESNVADPLITMMPIEYMKQGLGNNVPFLSGCVRDEGSYVVALMLTSYLEPNNYTDDGDYLSYQLIPDVLAAAGIDDTTGAFTEVIKNTFFPDVDMTSLEEITPGMIDFSGMLFLKSGTYNFAELHSRYYDSSTYFYSFDFVSDNSLFNMMFGGDPPFDGGVTHADELLYLFSLPSELTEDQRLTSQRLVKLWTNFAKTGNPTPPDTKDSWAELGIPEWKELTSENPQYLLIQTDVTAEMDYPERWTIEMQLEIPTGPTESTTTEGGGSVVSQAEYDELKKQSDAFMATMIVFIVLFVASTGEAIYLYLKTR